VIANTARMISMNRRRFPLMLMLVCNLAMTSCDPVTLTILGAGASAGVAHGLSSVAYKTFTAPIKRVNKATKLALKRMGIKVESVEKTDTGEVINATSSDRRIEVTLEAISNKTTRIRSIAVQDSIFFDQATAMEIVNQTERALTRRRT